MHLNSSLIFNISMKELFVHMTSRQDHSTCLRRDAGGLQNTFSCQLFYRQNLSLLFVWTKWRAPRNSLEVKEECCKCIQMICSPFCWKVKKNGLRGLHLPLCTQTLAMIETSICTIWTLDIAYFILWLQRGLLMFRNFEIKKKTSLFFWLYFTERKMSSLLAHPWKWPRFLYVDMTSRS